MIDSVVQIMQIVTLPESVRQATRSSRPRKDWSRKWQEVCHVHSLRSLIAADRANPMRQLAAPWEPPSTHVPPSPSQLEKYAQTNAIPSYQQSDRYPSLELPGRWRSWAPPKIARIDRTNLPGNTKAQSTSHLMLLSLGFINY